MRKCVLCHMRTTKAGLCLAWSETPEDTFCHDEAHIYIYIYIYVFLLKYCSYCILEYLRQYNDYLFGILVCAMVAKCWKLLNMKKTSYEPRQYKTNKVSVRPAKTQISLGIRPVWSKSWLSA